MDPVWSPNGQAIVFTSGGRLVTVNSEGRKRGSVAGALAAGGNGREARARTQFSPDGERIFFDGVDGLSVINAQGGRARRLAPPQLRNLTFALSPDGSKIAISAGTGRGPEVYVISSSGGKLHRLTYNRGTEDTDPVWSPDNRKIAFTTNRDGNWEIYTMNVDGSQQKNISRNKADDVAPAWRASP